MDNHQAGSAHNVYGILFTIVAVVALIALVLVVTSGSQADTTGQTAGVTNANPTIDTMNTAITTGGADQATVTPVENGLRNIFVHGVITDNNGCNDVDTVNNYDPAIYRTNVTNGKTCTADNNDCYQPNVPADVTLAGCTGPGDLNGTYEVSEQIQFYADPTDTGAPQAATNWTATLDVTDESGSPTVSSSDTFEMVSLLVFDVTANVNYGTLALGADSAQQTITFTATGNRALDADQTATSADSGNMVCDGQGSQNIPVGAAHLALGNGFTYGTADQPLSGASATGFNLTLPQRTDDASGLTKDAYLKLRMPNTGVRGTCTNTITFAAKADA